ncbi:hypothetical protein D3C71_1404950 [compost metagenome]
MGVGLTVNQFGAVSWRRPDAYARLATSRRPPLGRLSPGTALMIIIFRILIITAALSFFAAISVPFDAPFQIEVSTTSPPPWMAAAGAFSLAVLALFVATIALFFFRPWGRWLTAAAVVVGSASVLAASSSPIAQAVSPLSKLLLAVSALAWVSVVWLAYRSQLAARFKHKH